VRYLRVGCAWTVLEAGEEKIVEMMVRARVIQMGKTCQNERMS
jgi:hypothetical protein